MVFILVAWDSYQGCKCRLFPRYVDDGRPVDRMYMFFDASGNNVVVVIGLMEPDYLYPPRYAVSQSMMPARSFPLPKTASARTPGM
jgi:hypothetical protein